MTHAVKEILKFLQVVLFLLLFSFLKVGCQKTDVQTEKVNADETTVAAYFEGLPSESPLLAKVAAEL